jgi:proteasome lid subunit RPN8/RPN11
MERISDYSHKVLGNTITNSSREGAEPQRKINRDGQDIQDMIIMVHTHLGGSAFHSDSDTKPTEKIPHAKTAKTRRIYF